LIPPARCRFGNRGSEPIFIEYVHRKVFLFLRTLGQAVLRTGWLIKAYVVRRAMEKIYAKIFSSAIP
jgi:hypothetical protein